MPTAVSHDFTTLTAGQALAGSAPAVGALWGDALSYFPDEGSFVGPLLSDGAGVVVSRASDIGPTITGAAKNSVTAPVTSDFQLSVTMGAPSPSGADIWNASLQLRSRSSTKLIAAFIFFNGAGHSLSGNASNGAAMYEGYFDTPITLSWPLTLSVDIDRTSGDVTFLVNGVSVGVGTGYTQALDATDDLDFVVQVSAPAAFGVASVSPRLLSAQLVSSEAVTYPGGSGGGGGGGGEPPPPPPPPPPEGLIEATFATPGPFTRYTLINGVIETRPIEVVEELPPLALLVTGTDVENLTQAAAVVDGELVLQPPAFGPFDSQRFDVLVVRQSVVDGIVDDAFMPGIDGVEWWSGAPERRLFSGWTGVTVESEDLDAFSLHFFIDEDSLFFYTLNIGFPTSTTISAGGATIARPYEGWLPNVMSIQRDLTLTLTNSDLGGGVIADLKATSSVEMLADLMYVRTTNKNGYAPTIIRPFKITAASVSLAQFWTGFVGTYEVL